MIIMGKKNIPQSDAEGRRVAEHHAIRVASKSISRFIVEMDADFELIAANLLSFQELHEELTAALAEFGFGFGEGKIHRLHGETQALMVEMLSYIDDRSDAVSRVVSWLSAVEKPLEGALGGLTRIVSDCTDLMLLSINAKLLANEQTGNVGDTFSVITQELNQKSKEMKGIALELGNTIRSFGAKIEETHRAQQQIQRLFRDEIAGRAVDVETCYKQFEETDVEIAETISSSKAQAATLGPNLAALMNALQKQDILRQGLEHIIGVLSEIDSCGYVFDQSPGEIFGEEEIRLAVGETAFARSTLSLSKSLYEDTMKNTASFFDEVSDGLRRFGEVAGVIDALGRSWSNERREVVEKILRPARIVPEIRAQLTILDGLVVAEIKRLETVVSVLFGLSRKLENMRQMALDLSVIENGMRIKTAKSDILKNECEYLAAEIRKKNRDLVQSAESAQKVVIDIAEGGTNLLKNKLARYEVETSGIQKKADRLLLALEEETSNLSGFIERLVISGKRSGEMSETFLGTVSGFREQLFSRDVTDAFEQTAEIINARASFFKKKTSLSDDAMAAETRMRLKTIVDRFAVFSQKKIAKSVVDVDVIKGDAEGELTLF